MTAWDDEPGTSPGSRSRGALKVTDPPELELDADVHVALGQIMRAVTVLSRKVEGLALLPSEVSALRREIDDDRGALVHDSSRSAAKHSSNRVALLMGSLFSIYEVSSPYIHELWRAWHP